MSIQAASGVLAKRSVFQNVNLGLTSTEAIPEQGPIPVSPSPKD